MAAGDRGKRGRKVYKKTNATKGANRKSKERKAKARRAELERQKKWREQKAKESQDNQLKGSYYTGLSREYRKIDGKFRAVTKDYGTDEITSGFKDNVVISRKDKDKVRSTQRFIDSPSYRTQRSSDELEDYGDSKWFSVKADEEFKKGNYGAWLNARLFSFGNEVQGDIRGEAREIYQAPVDKLADTLRSVGGVALAIGTGGASLPYQAGVQLFDTAMDFYQDEFNSAKEGLSQGLKDLGLVAPGAGLLANFLNSPLQGTAQILSENINTGNPIADIAYASAAKIGAGYLEKELDLDYSFQNTPESNKKWEDFEGFSTKREKPTVVTEDNPNKSNEDYWGFEGFNLRGRTSLNLSQDVMNQKPLNLGLDTFSANQNQKNLTDNMNLLLELQSLYEKNPALELT